MLGRSTNGIGLIFVDVECNVKCPFCSKPLRRVSQAVRHPDECAVRKKQAVAVSETAIALKRPLSDLAFETLRSAQRAKKRRISQGANLWRSVEADSFAQVSSRVAGDTGQSSLLGLGCTSYANAYYT